MMRVLVTGGTGQLGIAVAKECEINNDTVLCAGSAELDVSNRELVLQVFGAWRPEVIIHCGAWTDVDGCETDVAKAMRINAWGSRNVAEAAANVGARVVAVSTDYVFDGLGAGPAGGEAYHEWDETNPLNAYGRSKLAGEREVLSRLGGDGCVVRTAWVCSPDGKNFLKTMLRVADAGAAENSPVTVVDDQHGSPTFTDDLARVLRELAVRRVSGVYHAANKGPTTWHGFAKAIFAASGHDAARVVPIKSADLLPARPAARPAYSLLDSLALDALGLRPMDDWSVALERNLRTMDRFSGV
jgi:dTDP-4-dehydrorhamnose reductase